MKRAYVVESDYPKIRLAARTKQGNSLVNYIECAYNQKLEKNHYLHYVLFRIDDDESNKKITRILPMIVYIKKSQDEYCSAINGILAKTEDKNIIEKIKEKKYEMPVECLQKAKILNHYRVVGHMDKSTIIPTLEDLLNHIIIYEIPSDRRGFLNEVSEDLRSIGASKIQKNAWVAKDSKSLSEIANKIKRNGWVAHVL